MGQKIEKTSSTSVTNYASLCGQPGAQSNASFFEALGSKELGTLTCLFHGVVLTTIDEGLRNGPLQRAHLEYPHEGRVCHVLD